MFEDFLRFIGINKLFSGDEKILLAISGGRDSMVMLDLFCRSDFSFGIGHVNFNLRGRESDEDELFIRKIAESRNIPFFTRQFDTSEYSNDKGISVQMAARELRYKWFEEIIREEEYSFVATAHHKDDEIETFMINLMRGTGIEGLSGIPVKRDRIIRPLLFFTREEIDNYAELNQIEYREDSSNRELKYLRNQVRHLLIPDILSLKADAGDNILKSINIIREQADLYFSLIGSLQEQLITGTNDQFRILKKSLQPYESPGLILFELLKDFGFHRDTIYKAAASMNDRPGRFFHSPSHELLVERESLLIRRRSSSQMNSTAEHYYLDKNILDVSVPISLNLEIGDIKDLELSADSDLAFLDADLLRYPLILRRWTTGDSFHPLGMKGSKLLSDFFIDMKVEVAGKMDTWLLCSGKDIIWVVGYRIDNRYRISDKTQRFLKVCYSR